MPRNTLRLGALAVMVAFSGCGVLPGSEPTPEAASGDHLEDQITSFRHRLSDLEQELAARNASDTRAAERARRAVASMRKRLERLTEAIAGTRGHADEAIAQVQAAVRNLSLLTERYDFHMRRYHGGE